MAYIGKSYKDGKDIIVDYKKKQDEGFRRLKVILQEKGETEDIQGYEVRMANVFAWYTIVDLNWEIILCTAQGKNGVLKDIVPTSVFDGCSVLASVTAEDGGSLFATEDNLIYNADKTTLLYVPLGYKGKPVAGGGFDGGFDFGDLGDIFGSFFGGGFGGGRRSNPNAPQRGESIRLSLAVTFEEAAFGCEKSVTVDRMEQCGTCHGNGCAAGATPEVCPDCHGTGQVQVRRQTPMGVFATTSPCSKCGGKGKIIHQPCKDCHGSGVIRQRRTIQATIPAGIDHGQTISIRGQGHAGTNGGPAGDLLITITVRPHELFRREGTSVLCEAPITFAQAVLGAELEIPTIDGKVKYDLPEGTQSGTTFRLKGKGIPAINGRGRGDQYVTVYIETPRNLNKEQKEALKKFAESVGDNNYEERKKFFKKFKK